MPISPKFRALIRDLNQESLADLRDCIAFELEQREAGSGFQVEQIRPQMSAAEREQAAAEIARALKKLS